MSAETPSTSTALDELSLVELARTEDPSLRPVKADYYLDFYDDMFGDVRRNPFNILEVGVFRGGSTLLFAKYFSRARILAVDIQEPPMEFHEAVARAGLSDRIKVVIVSQSDEDGLRAEIDSYFGRDPLDLVIDDASHLYRETRSTFDTVFGSYVRPGGSYVIEDWGCGYWPLWEDGHRDGRHGLPRLVKELVDLVALPDRTMLWEGERVLPVESESRSPISRAVITNSIAAFVRSDAEMPSPSVVWIEDAPATEFEASSFTASSPRTADVVNPAPGLRALLRQLPAAAARAGVDRWLRSKQVLSSERPHRSTDSYE